jgi:23S rRNA (pseudouridine1915-N3)-methyltransferase
MKIQIVTVGSVSDRHVRGATDDYLERLESYLPVEEIEVDPSTSGDPSARKREEAERIRGAIPEGAVQIALDERGNTPTSESLADWIEEQMVAGRGYLSFVIGGAFGLDAEVRRSSAWTFALSKLTMPHELARLVLAEQLYRSLTIVRGEPYHK